MKKILLISAFLITLLGFSQGIPKKFIPKITSDMVDPTYKETIEGGGSGGSTTINNTLTSTATDEALSANMGKSLKNLIDNLEVGGGSNAAYNIVTSTSQITSAGANAYILFQTNVDVSANYTPPANQIWIFTTGKISITGAYTLTGSNTKLYFAEGKTYIDAYKGTLAGTWISPDYFSIENIGGKEGGVTSMADFNITSGTKTVTNTKHSFTANDVGKVIAIVGASTGGKVHKSLITGYTNVHSVTIADNALVTVSNANGTVSDDNFNALKNAFYLCKVSNGSTLTGLSKTYYYSSVLKELLNRLDPTNLTISGKNIKLVNLTLRLIPHDLQKTSSIVFDKTTNITLENVEIYGDREIHGVEGIGKTEDSHGFEFRRLSDKTRLINCTASNFYGDGGIATGDYQFRNYINGSLKVTENTASTISVGTISRIDGTTINTGDATKYHTDSFLNISDSYFQSILETGKTETNYRLGGTSFAGWGGLSTPYFTAFYYDDAGTLLFVSENLYIYDDIPIQSAWKKVKFEFDTPADIANVELMAAPHLVATDFLWQGGEISKNGRDGISNPPDNPTFDNVYFYSNGYLAAGPAAGFNSEDRRRYNKNITLINCRWKDNKIDINFVGGENVLIQGNTLLGSTRFATSLTTGIRTYYGRNVRIIGNTSYNKSTSIDRGDFLTGNTFFEGEVTYTANDNVVKNNVFFNTLFKDVNLASSDRIGYPTIFEDNIFNYSKSWGISYLFNDVDRKASFINNLFRFNYFANYSNLITTNESIKFGEDNDKSRFFNGASNSADFGGIFKGNTFLGAKTWVSTRDYDNGNSYFPLSDFNNNNIGSSVEFVNDFVKDYVSENNKINGHVVFRMSKFPNTVTGIPKTIKIKGWVVKPDNDYAWTNPGANLIRTDSRYVNYEFINCVFDLQIASAVTGSTNRYMKLSGLGSHLFENCVFKSVTAKTIDFTNTNIFPANLGNVTIIDAITDGITFTLRSQDVLKYSKPNPNCMVFPDNATAVARMGVGWYYKDSSDSNKFKITY